MNIKRKIGGVLYYCFAMHLPRSYSGFRMGQTQLRRICGKLMLKHCGEKVNIEKNALFSPKVSLGDYSGIGVNAKIYGSCTIGDHVMMGEDVTVITRNHRHDSLDAPMMQQGFEEEKPVHIGNDVWIGDRATILPGVNIGDGSIIGAGSVVTHDVPAFSIVAGVPAKVISLREKRKVELRDEALT